jgi:hypothetical protein
MIFIGVSEYLEVIPWNPKQPAFHLEELNEENLAVKPNLNQPFVYFIGTSHGCSCDLISYSNVQDDEYAEEQNKFYSIIETQLQKGNLVEVYCCWADDYGANKEEVSFLKLDGPLTDFYIDERELQVYTSF